MKQDNPLPIPELSLAAARKLLAEAGKHLTQPETAGLDRAASLLAGAGARMREFCEILRTRQAPLAPELHEAFEEFRRELGQAGRLLHRCGAFYDGWQSLRSGQAGGYTSGGSPAAVEPLRRIALKA